MVIMSNGKKGFTLLELLVVIGILSVLATVAILVINPVEQLKQARDARRIVDIQTLNLSLSSAQNTNMAMGAANTIYVSIPDTSPTCANSGLPTPPTGWTYACATSANYLKVDGTGWIPVNIAGTGVSSMGTLPVDPTNSGATGLYYIYVSGGSYALSATLESDKYFKQNGMKDGGSDPSKFEQGSNLALLAQANGLVGYWPLDENGGSVAIDASGNGDNGTWSGTGTHYVPGKVGISAGQFDGVDDYINVPNNAAITFSTGDFSIAFWTIQYNQHQASWPRIMGKGSWQGDGWEIYIDRTVNYATFYSYQAGAAQGVDIGTISNTVPMHVAIVKSGTTVSTYLNGVLQRMGTIINPMASAQAFSMGVSPAGSVQYSRGMLDDVRLYDRALSPVEIRNMYIASK